MKVAKRDGREEDYDGVKVIRAASLVNLRPQLRDSSVLLVAIMMKKR